LPKHLFKELSSRPEAASFAAGVEGPAVMSVLSGDRKRAELVLENRRLAKESDELEAVDFPPVADRIRDARVQAGLSLDDVARRIGITSESCRDLELYDYEAFTVVSIKELAELGGILGVQPRVLLLGRDGEGGKHTLTCEDVTAHVAKKISQNGLTEDQLSEEIGWDIIPLLRDPLLLLSDYTVEALYDICKIVDCDWVAAIPDARKPRTADPSSG
jgi:transcriptional regulator with XRE-family HTH domain